MVKREVPLFSLSRARILNILIKNEPLSIEDISRKSNLSRAAIYNHLRTLRDKKLIIEKEQSNKLGQPIEITLSKDRESTQEILKKFMIIFPEEFNKNAI